jgi:hypothetical protein
MWKIPLFLFLFLSLPLAADAHTLETAGPLSLLLHVDPDDQAKALVPSHLLFEWSDRTGRFRLPECDCVFRATKENASFPIEASVVDDHTALAMFTFPEPGVYQVTAEGQPKSPEAFASFSFHFDVRVGPAPEDAPRSPLMGTVVPWIGRHKGASLAIAAAFLLFAYYFFKNDDVKNA